MLLRPINDTRRPNGTLTSETAYRLRKSRAGKARARQLKADGYKMLHEMALKSVLVRAAKARSKQKCHHCKALSEYLTRHLAALDKHPATPIQAEDLAKIS